jgi:hypothetical protein
LGELKIEDPKKQNIHRHDQANQSGANEEFEKLKAAIKKTQDTPLSDNVIDQVEIQVKNPLNRNATDQDLIEDFYEDELVDGP